MKINWRQYSHTPNSALLSSRALSFVTLLSQDRLPTRPFSTNPRNYESLRLSSTWPRLYTTVIKTVFKPFVDLWLGGHLPGRPGMWCFLGLRLIRLATIQMQGWRSLRTAGTCGSSPQLQNLCASCPKNRNHLLGLQGP